MKYSFTGSQRGWTLRQRDRVHEILEMQRPSCVIHGACIGADDEFDQLTCALGITRVVFPSNHLTKSAYPQCRARGGDIIAALEPMDPLHRNPLIVRAGDKLIACPKEEKEIIRSGTWATIRLGRRLLGRHNVILINP